MTSSNRVSLFVNIIAMVVISVLRRLLGLISIAGLARLLTPAEVGAYAFTQTVGQTFVNMFSLGVPEAVHVVMGRRLSSSETKEHGEILGCGIVLICSICAVGCAVMLLLAEQIAWFVFGEPELAAFIVPAAVFFAGMILSQGAYVGFAGLNRFVEYTYYATAISLASAGATILGALYFGAMGAVWALAGATLLGAPIFLVGLFRATYSAGINIYPNLRYPNVRQIFIIGLPFYGAVLFMIPAEFVAQGTVSRFGGIENLADLRVVMTLLAVVQLIPQAIAGPILSLFSERERRATGLGVTSAIEQMRWLWIFALIASATLAVVWPLAVTTVFGSGYPQVEQVGQLALVTFMPAIVGTCLVAGILVGGRSLPLLYIGAVQGAVMVGISLALIPQIGLIGFFAAHAAAGTTAVVLRLTVMGFQIGESPLRPWMAPLLLTTLTLSALLVLDMQVEETFLQRVLTAVVALPALCILIVFTAISRQEREVLLARSRKETRRVWARLSADRKPK